MTDVLKALANTPLPTILTFAGIAFLLFAIIPVTVKVKDLQVNRLSVVRQIVSGIIGGVLLAGGVFLFWGAAQPVNSIPTQQPQSTAAFISSPIVNSLETATPTLLSIPTQIISEDKIAITEVMASPCGGTFGPSVNEYIELYNYGSLSSDVGGWWFATNNKGEGVHPNKVVAWEARNPGPPIGNIVKVNSTIIPPAGFAIILSPKYYEGQGQYHMPYIFPQDTILLTIESGNFLGNDRTGLLGNTDPLSVIVLYKGTSTIIANPVSTYGSPKYGSAVDSVLNVGSAINNFPYSLEDCYSMERISASDPDVASNWRKVLNGMPGQGDYTH